MIHPDEGDIASPESQAKMEKTATRIVQQLESNPSVSEPEKVKEVSALLQTPDHRGELQKKLEDANLKLKRYTPASWNMTLGYDDGNVCFSAWSWLKLSFPAETDAGKMTWQLFSVFVIGFVLLWVIRNLFIFINNYYTRWVGAKVSSIAVRGVRNSWISLRFTDNDIA